MRKREFLMGTGLWGMAGLVGAASSPAPEKDISRSSTVFNVFDFGAKGDGKTPDSEAIQKALDAAGAVGGTVYFPAGRYLCHDLKAHAHTTLLAEPQWGYRGDAGAMLLLDSDQADCLLNITGAFGVHLRGLFLQGNREAKKVIHGVFLNNAEKYSPKEDAIVIDDCKIERFSGNGVYLLRIWLFIIRHSIMQGNKGCGIEITGWDGFVTDNQLSGNGSHGFACNSVGATVMFTANRVEWNRGYGLYLCAGDAWNVTGNCFDRNGGAGVCAVKMRTTTITGNVFRRCGKDSRQLPEGERSCQVRLEECSGLTFVSNVCAAGRDDGGKGTYTPQVGFYLRKLSHSVISSNTLFQGYTNEMTADLGSHGPDYVFANNVGCPMK
ncbi:MAG TPA: right-handed parallel beta-helix repeat-containing protein [Candidatus Paceibacterota bacterium]|nr:right-handed parallel beta-helix repeat-containing protein [Verrucomicrobiota bacterium]HRY48965.1 right-handed parallel beta-helix repeat-containing protein [Candidatus Paceibacterota bacterium]HSA02910.1 right-handed parallel beta-helix repeat-containing protein [Candidatus Paceibacterota bacterium]